MTAAARLGLHRLLDLDFPNSIPNFLNTNLGDPPRKLEKPRTGKRSTHTHMHRVHTWMCIYTETFMQHIYICSYKYMYSYVYMIIYIYICLQISLCVQTNLCIFIRIHVCVCVCTCMGTIHKGLPGAPYEAAPAWVAA